MPSLVCSKKLARSLVALGETVVDPSVWPDVMERLCEAVGATGAGLLRTDVRTPDIPRTPSTDEALDLYFREGWQARDSRVARRAPLLNQGVRVIIDQDLFTAEELERDPFLNDFYYRHGFQSAAAVAFNAGSALWTLCLHRTAKQARFDAEDRHVLSKLPNRLSEVATLSATVGRVALTTTINALGLVHGPAIAIDRFGVVLDANDNVDEIFDDDLNIRNNRLTTTDRRAATALGNMMDRFLETREDAPLAAQPVVVHRTERPPVVIRAMSIPPAARDPFLGARALLTFTVVGQRVLLEHGLLQATFSLTPSEAKLAALITAGLSTEAAAARLSIKRETVRNQLKTIFAKTGTRRQPELVALVSTLRGSVHPLGNSVAQGIGTIA